MTDDFRVDSDGDGVADVLEALVEADLRDSGDYFRITGARTEPENIVLEWKSVAGVAYGIEWSATAEARTWVPIETGGVIRAIGSRTATTLPRSGLGDGRHAGFYRIRSLQED